MAKLQWSNDLNTNINIIDDQHKVIVDYINELDDFKESGDSEKIGDILKRLAAYTISHLDFEEGLLEKAAYVSIKPHQRIHELFRTRIAKYVRRHKDGEDVAREVQTMLANWLFDHIRKEDFQYVAAVGPLMSEIVRTESAWVSQSVNKLFR